MCPIEVSFVKQRLASHVLRGVSKRGNTRGNLRLLEVGRIGREKPALKIPTADLQSSRGKAEGELRWLMPATVRYNSSALNTKI